MNIAFVIVNFIAFFYLLFVNMKSIVISYGGSVILSDDVDVIFFQKLYSIFNSIVFIYQKG